MLKLNTSGRSLVDRVRRRLATDDLLHHGGIMAAATVASGGLNYAYQVFIGRALGPAEYGVFGALFALFYLVNVLGRGIRLSATRFTAELSETSDALATFQRGFLLRALVFGFGIFVLLAVMAPTITSFLDINSPWLVVIVALTVPFSLSFTANQGTFQGLQHFFSLGGYMILRGGLKLGLGIGFVVLGYGVQGALGALVVATAIAFIVTTSHHHLTLPSPSPGRFDYEKTYRYIVPAVLAGFCLTVPATVDVILVKHFYTNHQAGLYTAASVLGKALVFLPMGISTALFPKVSSTHMVATGSRLSDLLNRAILYTFAIAGIGALAFWFFPAHLLRWLFGAPYTDAALILQWYGLAIAVFVLAVVVLNYQLAQNQTRFVYIFAAASLFEIALIWVFHDPIVRVVQVVLLVNVVLLIIGIIIAKK